MPQLNRKPLPSVFDLTSVLRYDHESGKLWWRSKGTARSTGLEYPAGHLENTGYIAVVVFGMKYASHRLIWKMITGKDPEFDLDHIDGNKTNNRISNLREASRIQNRQNARIPKNNSTGIKGVGWNVMERKWVARIQSNHEKFFLGYFKSKTDAESAVREKRRELHKQFTNHG